MMTLIAAGGLAGCDFNYPKSPEGDTSRIAPEYAGDAPSTPPESSIPRPVTFTVLKNRVLDVSCNSCHAPKNEDGLTDLTTWEGLKSVENLVIPLVFGVAKGDNGREILVPKAQRMPPEETPFTEEEGAILLLWYADGKLGPDEK